MSTGSTAGWSLTSPTSRVALVAAHDRLTTDIHSLWLREPGLARRVRPGQFVNARCSAGPDPVLRRPISVADVTGAKLRLVFRVKGRGTALLAALRPGDGLDLFGPLGRPAPDLRNLDILVCGGGVGIAPLLFLARHLVKQNRVKAVLGARSRQELILAGEFAGLGIPVRFATDDGSRGHRGPVTDLIPDDTRYQIPDTRFRKSGQPSAVSRRPSAVFACGPKPMLAALVKKLHPVPVWGFIEERMGCGTGICYCCALPKKEGGYVRFCEEGPVVLLNEVRL